MKENVTEKPLRQVALVNGATGGIGQAICRRLAMTGMHVVMLGRDEHKLAQCKRALSDLADRPLSLSTRAIDTTDPEGSRATIDDIARQFGAIDLLVNAAGDGPVATLLETTEARWQQSIQGKLMGAIRLTQYAAAHMCRRGRGQIVIVNGVFSKEPHPLFVINSTINCALAGFAKSVARDLGPHGVRTNTINPGATQTALWSEAASAIGVRSGVGPEAITAKTIEQIPLGRLATPDDVANVVALLASPDCGYLNGVAIAVDGGATAAL